jgi:uncharacterized protein with PQ loop repeat
MDLESVSWCLNVLSNLLWLCIFLPQLYINYKLKNSEAISLSLLLLLIFGEVLAITSGYYKNLHIIVLLTGFYHVFFECILVTQIIYYRYFNIIKRRIIDSLFDDEFTPLLNMPLPKSLLTIYEIYLITSITITYIILFCLGKSDFMGDLIAWLATIIFTISRIPQITLNYERKSTEGLAISSFIILMLSSLLYLISILLVNDWIDIIQWIFGVMSSLLFFDSIILYQFLKYDN